jgi:hypothetical protein
MPHDHNAVERSLEDRQEGQADPRNPSCAPPGYLLHRSVVTEDGKKCVGFHPPVPCNSISRAMLYHMASKTWVPMKHAMGGMDEYGAWATPLPRAARRASSTTHPAPSAIAERPL